MISDCELMQMIREGERLGYSAIVEALVELEAYRKAFSKPAAYTSENDLAVLASVGTMHLYGKKELGDIALYRKPIIPD